ncbi:MAG: DUF2262 domain-containing protein [Candidatus Obscuribacterales bacterium]|nr:DUF2262 domain-containing protein [Candidatus Obscuribacterales bacterium]
MEVKGVVHPPGAGGGKVGKEEFWTLRFTLQPWRNHEGRIQESKLSLSRPGLTREELKEQMAMISSYEVLKLKISQPEAKEAFFMARILDEPVKFEEDGELNELSLKLQEPLTLTDARFGTLSFDRSLNWFECAADWQGKRIHLYIALDKEDSAEASLENAGRLFLESSDWEAKIRDFAVESLLELKNDTWLDEDEEMVNAAEFKERISLQTITVYANGDFEFCLNDGGLFWGHAILIAANLSNGLKTANIVG